MTDTPTTPTSEQAVNALHALDNATTTFVQKWNDHGRKGESLIIDTGGPLVIKVLATIRQNGVTEKASQDLLMIDHFRSCGLADETVTSSKLRGWADAAETWGRLSKERQDSYKPYRQAYALRDAKSLPDETPEDGKTRSLDETVAELVRRCESDPKERSQKAQSKTVREYGKKLPPKEPPATADSLSLSEQVTLVREWVKADGKRGAMLLEWCEGIPAETVAAIVAFGASAHEAVKPSLGPAAFSAAVLETVSMAAAPPLVDEQGDGLLVKVDPAEVLAGETVAAA